MNDTTRQLGGAIGVAVLGSVLATTYRPGVTSRLSGLGLSTSALTTARGSVGGAVSVAASLPPALASQVIAAGRSEFVHAFASALIVAASVMMLAAAVVFAFLPARAPDADHAVERPWEGVASLAFAEADGALEDTQPHGAGVTP